MSACGHAVWGRGGKREPRWAVGARSCCTAEKSFARKASVALTVGIQIVPFVRPGIERGRIPLPPFLQPVNEREDQ